MTERNHTSDGFTLIELIVNIAIIGLLAAIAIPAFMSQREKAKIAQAKSELRNIQIAIVALENDTERWPGPQSIGITADKEIWDLTSPKAGLLATDGNFPNWSGPYIGAVPKDPWGMDYFFDPDYDIGGVDYPVIGSFGPNKEGKNAYDSDDVVLVLPTN